MKFFQRVNHVFERKAAKQVPDEQWLILRTSTRDIHLAFDPTFINTLFPDAVRTINRQDSRQAFIKALQTVCKFSAIYQMI